MVASRWAVSGFEAMDETSLREALTPVLDAAGFLPSKDCGARYLTAWSGQQVPPAPVVRPATPESVASVMAVLHRLGQRAVVQGGMTGLVGGALPQDGEVILSLERLNKIESLDEVAGTMTVQAGVPLETVQTAAEARSLFFPVDIGSRGSCQVGGLIATNAGGNRVLRYGMMRQSVLGLEAVLPDGRVVSRMGGMLKDNAGYDLAHLFIGTEGTLGIVTRAILALQPLPGQRHTALVSVPDFEAMAQLLMTCRRHLGAHLTSFEVMWRDYYDLVTGPMQVCRSPITQPGALLVLVESMGTDAQGDDSKFMAVLTDFLEAHEGSDAVLAQSLAEGLDFWSIRDASGEAANAIGPYAAYDVSLPLARMGEWVELVHVQLRATGHEQTQTYGHVGDGNLHLVVQVSDTGLQARQAVDDIVYGAVGALGGSVSAEHGIGIDKKKVLGVTRSENEIELMRSLKLTLDPKGLLNQGRVFDVGG
jgi:FAD/FMN-containing dehydrogenase